MPWKTLLPAVLLTVTVLGVMLRDYLTPVHSQTMPDLPDVLDPVARLRLRFHDEKIDDELEKLWMTEPQPSMRFGLARDFRMARKLAAASALNG